MPDSAPVVVAPRLPTGSCGSLRGAGRLIADAIATTRRLPSLQQQKILMRADSPYYGHPSISATLNAGADASVTARMTTPVKRAITTIPDNRWQTIQYPDAIFDEDTERWISSTEIAEVPFAAFSLQKKAKQIPSRLVVRRIPELKKKDVDQPGLFDLYRFHAVHHLTRIAGIIAGAGLAKATTTTIRRRLVTVPARIAHSARRLVLHLPEQGTRLFDHGHSPPVAAAG